MCQHWSWSTKGKGHKIQQTTLNRKQACNAIHATVASYDVRDRLMVLSRNIERRQTD